MVGAYGYDGLNRRITRTIGSDDAIHEYYSESWQRIESRPGGEASTTGVSLFVFGIRYIDDSGAWASRPPSSFLLPANASGPPEERRYYLTDANYNVSMIVTDAGYGVERVFYTAYGEPECFPFGDVDGDYDVVDPTDKNAMIAIKDGQAPYNILADLNLDGAVTQADVNAFGNYAGYSGGRGVLTASNGSATTGNDIGYAGYTWNDERAQWHVRHREYDPKLGRWLQRDPAGYIDGFVLAEFVGGSPLSELDFAGLSKGGNRNIWPSKLPTHLKQMTFEEAIRYAREHGIDLTHDEINKLKKFYRYRPRPGFVTPGGLVAPATIGLGVLIDHFLDAIGEFPEDPDCRAVVAGIARGNCDLIERKGLDCCTNVAARHHTTYQACEELMNELLRRCRKTVAECPPPTEPVPEDDGIDPTSDPGPKRPSEGGRPWWHFWGGMHPPPPHWSPDLNNPVLVPFPVPGLFPPTQLPSNPGLVPYIPHGFEFP